MLERNACQGRERPRCAVAHQAVDPPRLPATIAVHRHASRHGGGNGSEGLTVRANEGRARDVHGRDVPHGHQDLIVCWGGNLLCLLVLEKPAGGELGSLHCAQRLDACAKCTVCLRDRLLNVKAHADGVVALPAPKVHRHAGTNATRVLLGAVLLERAQAGENFGPRSGPYAVYELECQDGNVGCRRVNGHAATPGSTPGKVSAKLSVAKILVCWQVAIRMKSLEGQVVL